MGLVFLMVFLGSIVAAVLLYLVVTWRDRARTDEQLDVRWLEADPRPKDTGEANVVVSTVSWPSSLSERSSLLSEQGMLHSHDE